MSKLRKTDVIQDIKKMVLDTPVFWLQRGYHRTYYRGGFSRHLTGTGGDGAHDERRTYRPEPALSEWE